ncbi:hypothetical protein NO004_40068 [Flavobacterium psychrophilum]|uniref:hypothetical protein n=1 Tax=Flavobacterium psychrophilum TaxID=96345 RepID=UPI000B7C10CC|nr:hypothetical protein [Flavobacterium psychrophilum]SNB26555.1 hypothetical protein NO004_40068 [Flavobacterium psychrophilum]
MTKKEIIIKAWEKFPTVNHDKNNGFAISYCINGVTDILDDPYGKIEYEHLEEDIIKWRPISLKGIENNNGWIKIGEDNLIHFEGDLWGVTKNKEVFFFSTDEFIEKGLLTHYQPIIKPNLPLY